MNSYKLRQIAIKKAQLLIDKEIGDKLRLEQIQMKIARGLPLFTENQVYLDALILENISEEEVGKINLQIDEAKLEKSEISQDYTFHCICCGNVTKRVDGGGMCANCFLDYNEKIYRFLSSVTGGGM